jgi:hypothetical protein
MAITPLNLVIPSEVAAATESRNLLSLLAGWQQVKLATDH